VYRQRGLIANPTTGLIVVKTMEEVTNEKSQSG